MGDPEGMSAYRTHAEKIVALVNELLDAVLAYRRLLEEELRAGEGRRGYHWMRLRKRAISEIDDVVPPIEDVVLDRVIRLMDRVMTLEKPDSDKDFV